MAVGTPGPSLSSAGREAAVSFRRRCRDQAQPDRLWVSPAARARETATILFGDRSSVVRPELAEIAPGAWGSPGFAGGTQKHGCLMRRWETGSELTIAPPGGESGEEVVDRLRTVVHALSVIEDAERVVLVTHFGVIRMMVRAFVHEFGVDCSIPPGFPYLLQSVTLRKGELVV
ncbi:MAG: histidine phosphatase family protein [Micrococcales bacterium]|nr:histidine phosphatase family protein [Micrococcales bacterium]